MAKRQLLVGISAEQGHIFSDSLTGDVAMVTARSNQRLLLGTAAQGPSELQVSREGVSVSARLGVGTALPAVALDIRGKDALQLPVGCNLERPATALPGMVRYNAETGYFEGVVGTSNWAFLGGVADPDGDTYVSAASNDNVIRMVASNQERVQVHANRVRLSGLLSLEDQAFVRVGQASNETFLDSLPGDLLASTTSSNQRLLFGTKTDDVPELVVSSVTGVSAARRLGVGTTAPAYSLDVRATDALLVPAGCNEERPGSPRRGLIRYNTDAARFEGYGQCNAWSPLTGVSDVNLDTFISAEQYPGCNDDCLKFFTSNQERLNIDRNRVKVAGFLSIASLGANLSCNAVPFETVRTSFWSKNSNQDLYYLEGGMGIGTSNPRAKVDIEGSMAVGGNILPTSNDLYDLGSSNLRFRDLYLSGNTLYLGDRQLTGGSNGELVIDGVLKSTGGIKIGDVQVVDSAGQVQVATLAPATTSGGAGVVTLQDSVASFCNDRAATPNAVRLAFSNADTRLPISGGTVSGHLVVSSNLTVAGDLTINGSTTVLNAEAVSIKDNLILLNSCNAPLPPSAASGIEISRAPLSNYQFVFVEGPSLFKVGTTDALQAVATRPDAIVDRSLLFWDAASNWLVFDSNVKVSSAGTLSATFFVGSGSNLTDLDADKITQGFLPNARTTATSENLSNAIVARNSNGSFSASTISACNLAFGAGASKATLAYASNVARTFTVPEPGADAQFVMTAGDQTIGGFKTFSSDLTCSGTVSSGTGFMFRNRVMNGDMRVDQRGGAGSAGAGGLAGSNLAYKVQPSSFYALDRWAVSSPGVGALVAKQVTLSPTDRAATGGFGSAASVGLVPTDSLAVYLPLDGSLTDSSGNNVSVTTVGTMQYVNASVVWPQALYLSNDANVQNTPQRASNRILLPYIQASGAITTLCYWFCCTKLPTNTSLQSTICSFGLATNAGNINTYMQFASATTATFQLYNAVNNSTAFTITANTWYHVTYTANPGGTSLFYVNGNLIGSAASTPTTGFIGSVNILLGDNLVTSATQPYAGFIDDFRVYSRELSATEIAALATSVGIAAAAPGSTVGSGLTSRLTFDNTVADAQGTLAAPTITPTGSNAVFTPTAKVGSAALDLTANTAGGTALYTFTYTLPTVVYNVPLTMSCWFNASSVASTQVIATIGNTSAVSAISVNIFLTSSAKVSFYVRIESTGYTITANETLLPGVWYNAVLTVNSSGFLNGYLHGILAASVALPAGSLGLNAGSGPIGSVRVGAEMGSTLINAFRGFVDDVRIYNRVLTSGEVAALFASSQYASYSLFQQTIEGNNLHDLAWGTPNAQPVTASMWLKNNTSTPQQFSVSLDNASGLVAWIDFEGGSFADKMGFLNNFTNVGAVPASTSIFKIGAASLNLTGNTAGGTASRALLYSVPFTISIPITLSAWIYVANITATGVFNVALSLGNGTGNNTISANVYTYQGSIYGDFRMGGVTYSQNSGVTHASNTWYNVCFAIGNGRSTLYVDGVAVASRTFPPGPFEILNGNGQPNQFCIGANTGLGSNLNLAYNGYIDDVRIYNKALSATQVAQLYANNVNFTTTSTYLTPRSVVYNTPFIPANSWQKISVTVPGDTINSLMTNNDGGLTLSLALGATSLYSTSNVAASTGNSIGVYNNLATYAGSNVQAYGSSSSNFLSSVANTILVTGVQLERGPLMTPFEFRPYGTELALCQRYFQKSYPENVRPGTPAIYDGMVLSTVGGTNTEGNFNVHFKANMRSRPSVITYGPRTGTPGVVDRRDGTGGTPATTTLQAASGLGSFVNISETSLAYAYSGGTAAFWYNSHWIADAEL